MTTKQVKTILKDNGVNASVIMGSGTLKNQIGIFKWSFDVISAEKLKSLFPNIIISSNGQAWLSI